MCPVAAVDQMQQHNAEHPCQCIAATAIPCHGMLHHHHCNFAAAHTHMMQSSSGTVQRGREVGHSVRSLSLLQGPGPPPAMEEQEPWPTVHGGRGRRQRRASLLRDLIDDLVVPAWLAHIIFRHTSMAMGRESCLPRTYPPCV